MLSYNQDLHYQPEKFPDRKAGDVTLDEAIKRSQEFFLSIQYPEGYWWGELESNSSILSELVLLYKIYRVDHLYPLHKIEAYLRRLQRSDNGAWELFYGDGGELSVTIETYMAMRLLNVPASDPTLQKARHFILERGGISRSRIFTKFNLALIGCYDWRGIPSLPAWVMLLPNWFFTNVYEMSSWARTSTIPLVIVFDKRPVYSVSPTISLDELYLRGRKNAPVKPSFKGDWTDVFLIFDTAFKLAERFNVVPFRERGLKAAEKYIIERQEESGGWAGIFPAMYHSLLALRALNYPVSDPIVHRGLEALRSFSMETEDEYWIQACISPVWDTALVLRALVDSGLPPDHPALQRAGEWLLEKQILQDGDWAVKKHCGQIGAWAFEFFNKWHPDVDDTAVVVMALNGVLLPNEALKKNAIERAVKWIETMQCKGGGWGAFDVDNDQDWLNATPYGDLKAMIDPNTADVTARVLEMSGRLKKNVIYCTGLPPNAISRGRAYLRQEQEKEGCWFGRWGTNYIYGTSGVLVALSLNEPEKHGEEIDRGAKWLVEVQRKNKAADGGWAETGYSYHDPSLKGKGDGSTPSQTAWGVLGLLAAGDALGKYEVAALEDGIGYLLKTQRVDGSWHESCFTGTGFPAHFYLRYHLYAQHFPLSALGRYRARLHAAGNLRNPSK